VTASGPRIEQLSESVSGLKPAAHELHRALGERARRDHVAHHRGGEVCRLGRGFDDCRNAREHGGRELLEHAPHREVEGVDLQYNTAQRRVHMLSDKRPGFADRLEVTVGEEISIRQLAPAPAAEDECRSDPAVDIAGCVTPRRAGRQRELVIRGLAGVEVGGQVLQRRGAFLERETAERGTTHAPRMLDELSGVEAGGGHPRNRIPGRRVDDRRALVRRGVPLAGDVAGEHLRHQPAPGAGDEPCQLPLDQTVLTQLHVHAARHVRAQLSPSL